MAGLVRVYNVKILYVLTSRPVAQLQCHLLHRKWSSNARLQDPTSAGRILPVLLCHKRN